MCDPITLAGVALTGASTAVNGIAAGKVARARDDALAAERIRQSGFDRETDALNTRSQDRYQDFTGQQDAKASELGQYFTDQATPTDGANASAAIPVSTSNVTVQEEAKQRGAARDFTNSQGQKLGQLRAFGDVLGGIGREQARDAGQIGQIGGFKRGSSSILPMDLEAANSKGSGMRLFGDILGGLGSVTTAAGLNGLGGDTIANSLEIKMGADPWRGLRTVGDKSLKSQVRLGNLY